MMCLTCRSCLPLGTYNISNTHRHTHTDRDKRFRVRQAISSWIIQEIKRLNSVRSCRHHCRFHYLDTELLIDHRCVHKSILTVNSSQITKHLHLKLVNARARGRVCTLVAFKDIRNRFKVAHTNTTVCVGANVSTRW